MSPTLQRESDVQLSELARMLRASLRQLHEHPLLAWITPRPAVRLIESGGAESLWIGGVRQDAGAARVRAAPFTALELPAELTLSRKLVMPRLSGADLRAAIGLEVRDSNPFEPADLVWGYRAVAAEAGQMDVIAVLASRRQVAMHLLQAGPELAASTDVEIWARVDDGAPVVLQGFGEGARARRAARGRWAAWGLIIIGLMIGIAIAVTPTVQLRLRTLQAVGAYQVLQQRAGPAVAQREALVRGREDLATLREVMSEHVDPMVALDMLTQLIPDDTWVQRVQAQGNRFTLTGQTPNAAVLMNRLSTHPGLRDVRAPAATTRSFGTNRETFVVEFSVEPNLLQRGPGSTGPAPIALDSSAPAVPVVAIPSMPASAPAAAASTPAAPASAPTGSASMPKPSTPGAFKT